MNIKEILAKTIITKSKLPNSDFVINPYIGCQHGCKYCYAKFMQRFSGHAPNEIWGNFVDIKVNAAELITDKHAKKYQHKNLTIGSVTDPYQPLEAKYQLTRKILQKLVPLQPNICVMTKSALVTRDIDLLKQLPNCTVAISCSLLDENIRKKLEPAAAPANTRIGTLKQLRESGIKTALFIAPIFPVLSDWESIIKQTMPFVDEYWFENLFIYPHSKSDIYQTLYSINPNLLKLYNTIYSFGDREKYWENEQGKIAQFCTTNSLTHAIFFHKII